MNQTQVVRSFINTFIFVAVGVSLFQQLMNSKSSSVPTAPPTVTTQTGQQVPLQMTGPKIQGIRIQSSDKFHTPLKQLLAKNQMNVEITSFEFQGNQYWLNMALNWGHIVLVYVLIGKYKTQTNQSTKKKIMIGGALAVMAWFYFSSQFKPQRLAIQAQGLKVYEKQYFDDKQIVDILSQYEFEVDDLKQAAKQTSQPTIVPGKDEAWTSNQQKPVEQAEQKSQNTQEVHYQEQIF